MSASKDRPYIDKAIDIAVRLVVIAIIIYSGFKIMGPFIMPILWGVILAVATASVYNAFKKMFGGRDKLAGTLYILLGLAVVVIPAILLGNSVIDGASGLHKQLEDGTFRIPPPQAKVENWPLIGERTYALWNGASQDLDGTVSKLTPQLKKIAGKVGALLADAGGAVIQSVFAIIIAGILLMNSAGAGRTAKTIGRTLAGEKGPQMVDMSAATIRSVVKGVLAVAALQAVLSLIGLYIAHVPAAAFWALLVMIVAIMQLPPIIILGPIAIWVFSASDSTGIAIFFLIYSLIVSGSDGWLKPLFLGRGVDVPMLVILIGAIGGMLNSGIIGLFVGAVILAIAYTLVKMWLQEEAEEAEAEKASQNPA